MAKVWTGPAKDDERGPLVIKAIAFDLDDTLINTSGLLVPEAAVQACKAMQAAGLTCTLQECLDWRAALAPHHSHREIFNMIAQRAGAANIEELGDVGSRHFYNPPNIPDPLELLEGALDVLNHLRGKYLYFLVTSGAPETQWRKIHATRLKDRFDGIFIVDKFKGENKGTYFQTILQQWSLQPAELLSVGNRLREEIRHAKKRGCQTCYFEHGEHVGEIAEQPEDIADFRVKNWSQFIEACKL